MAPFASDCVHDPDPSLGDNNRLYRCRGRVLSRSSWRNYAADRWAAGLELHSANVEIPLAAEYDPLRFARPDLETRPTKHWMLAHVIRNMEPDAARAVWKRSHARFRARRVK